MIKTIVQYSLFSALLIGSVVNINAQESQDIKIPKAKDTKKGDKAFENLSYVDAREAYLKVHEKGFKSANLYEKLGDSYYFTADYNNAEKWYNELYNLEGEATKPEYLYRYGLTLKTLKNYDKSDELMEVFNKANNTDVRADLFVNERNYLEEIELNSGRFTLKNADFNSELSDYGPAYYGHDLVISSNRKKGRLSRRVHSWNNQPFSDLMLFNGDAEDLDKFSKKINTKYHESTPVFTKDKKTVYFTRNNFTNKDYKSDKEGTNRLKLYKGVQDEDDNWTVTELPFNSDDYSVAHPALNVEETVLYFASDMEGGLGKSDIYRVSIDEDTYGEPVNLGRGINTEGRETFPFISADNELFFASNGHVGLGGLDIFVADMYTDEDFSDVYNVGKPVNSEYDDFTFIIKAETRKGYFASNRTNGKGHDDIYSFVEKKKLVIPFEQTLEGVVKNETTNEPEANVKVSLLNDKGNVIAEVISDENGNYTFPLERAKQYSIRFEKDTFETIEKPFTSSNENGKVFKDEEVVRFGNDLENVATNVGDDLNKILGLNPIYFDLDKSFIRPDAEIELQKVIAVMEQYPNLVIDVRSHTDSRANDAYNMALSDRRNKSTIKYIIEKGNISKDRLSGKGYGESQLTNNCSNGVKCTKAQHQLNRRSEFIIVKQ